MAMSVKKRQRCLGALARREHDVNYWLACSNDRFRSPESQQNARNSAAKALTDVTNLRRKLGIIINVQTGENDNA